MIILRGLPSLTVHAATLEKLNGAGAIKDVATIESLESLFSNAITAIVSLSAVALFLMLVIGGFSFLYSGGDQKKLEQARGTLTNAIIGLVVIVSAYLILRIVGAITGLNNLTIFQIKTN